MKEVGGGNVRYIAAPNAKVVLMKLISLLTKFSSAFQTKNTHRDLDSSNHQSLNPYTPRWIRAARHIPI